jgi:hypothetical protein
MALGCDAFLRDCVLSKLNSSRRESVAARILSLLGPDGHRDAISFVFDLVKIDCVSSQPYTDVSCEKQNTSIVTLERR